MFFILFLICTAFLPVSICCWMLKLSVFLWIHFMLSKSCYWETPFTERIFSQYVTNNYRYKTYGILIFSRCIICNDTLVVSYMWKLSARRHKHSVFIRYYPPAKHIYKRKQKIYVTVRLILPYSTTVHIPCVSTFHLCFPFCVFIISVNAPYAFVCWC